MTIIPAPIRTALKAALNNAQRDGGVFDAYSAAIETCEAFPDAQIPIDSLIDFLIANLGCIQAVEISPPALMIEILFEVDDRDEVPPGSNVHNLFEAA